MASGDPSVTAGNDVADVLAAQDTLVAQGLLT